MPPKADLGRTVAIVHALVGTSGRLILAHLGWKNKAASACSCLVLAGFALIPGGGAAIFTFAILVLLSRISRWSPTPSPYEEAMLQFSATIAAVDACTQQACALLDHLDHVLAWNSPARSALTLFSCVAVLLTLLLLPHTLLPAATIILLYSLGLCLPVSPLTPATPAHAAVKDAATATADNDDDWDDTDHPIPLHPSMPLAPSAAPPPAELNRAGTEVCAACIRPFTALRWRYYCQSCGRAFCKACCQLRVPAVPPSPGASETTASKDMVRVCQPCFQRRQTRAPRTRAGSDESYGVVPLDSD